ncbi:aminopeptidase P family protein, partial [Candidatus Phytoplasma phoenicium]|uniref:aminopeptidase P family protein n=1 Tax=Candidatus Phytoplasma phoenicium TaxID=198422 RepID=UPI00067B4C73
MNSKMFENNRNCVLNYMEPQSISLFFSGKNLTNFHSSFCVDRNFYYLTGIEEENAILMLVKGIQSQHTFLFIPQKNTLKSLWDGESLSHEQAQQKSAIDINNIKNHLFFEDFLSCLLRSWNNITKNIIKKIYFAFYENQMLKNQPNIILTISRKIRNSYPSLQIDNITPLLAHLRTVKNISEIQKIKEAININRKSLYSLIAKIKPNIYEYQIAGYYNYLLAQHNTKPAFETIIASGKNALVLHYHAKKDVLKENDMILLDLGVNYNNYNSDVSRCFPVNGTFSPQQKAIYQIVLDANKKIIKWLQPGKTFTELNQYGKKILFQGLKQMNILQEEKELINYCYHGLGHFLGLEVHDVGNIHQPFRENNIITVEPGLYLPKFNLGIR